MTRSSVLLIAGMAAVLGGCTSGADVAGSPSPSATGASERTCPVVDDGCEPIEVHGAVFDLGCIPVPPFLLDVPLGARWGGAKVRAVAAVPSIQAVAVMSPDPGACGEWTLAMRTDLSPEVQTAIEREVRAAASLPPDPGPGDDPAE